MTKNEAMQLALTILLEYYEKENGLWDRTEDAIDALLAALAQPDEQIDIKGAEMNTNRSGNLHEVMHQAAWDSATRVPEGDIRALKHRIHELEGEVIGYKQILDTQPEPEPEPVAWYYAGNKVEPKSVALDCDLDDAQKANCMPLYTAPPQRKPLTDEQIKKIRRAWEKNDYWLNELVRAIEEAHGIKEKNNG